MHRPVTIRLTGVNLEPGASYGLSKVLFRAKARLGHSQHETEFHRLSKHQVAQVTAAAKRPRKNIQGVRAMPVFSPNRFVSEVSPVEGCPEPNQTLWISEAGELTQFGAFVEVLQPGCRSSIKHWHSAEDEMVYVLAGEITVIEGASETLMRAGDAATFKAGVAVGHCLEGCVRNAHASGRCRNLQGGCRGWALSGESELLTHSMPGRRHSRACRSHHLPGP